MKHIPATIAVALMILGSIAQPVRAETITVATYNVEMFHQHFVPTSQPIHDPDLKRRLESDADKDLWIVSRVILDPKFSPDIIGIEECCEQHEVDKFNKQWLNGAYGTVIVFPTNTTRDQNLGLMLKPGFKVLERKDQYYLEPDTIPNPRGQRLFARGPSFVLVQSPGGSQFWVGVTHEKSKYGNSVDVTKWRDREATRLHNIVKDLEHSGKGNGDVCLVGDMNDELGCQAYEQQAGGDSISLMVGPPSDGFILATRSLIEAGEISFGGYWRSRYRSFIDQIILTPELKNQIQEVKVFQSPLASVASDHYPVYIKLKISPTR